MRIIQYVLTVLVLFVIIGNFSCKKKPEPPKLTAQQEQAQKLGGSWSVSSVDTKPSGVTDNTVIDGLSMTFNIDADKNPTSFSATGAPDFFVSQSSSTWAFSGSSTTVITLTDVSPVDQLSITSLDGSTLKISFTLTTIRTESLDGNYSLTLTK